MTRITHRAYLYGDIRLLEHSTSSLYISEILKVGKAFNANQSANLAVPGRLRFLHCTIQSCNVTTKFKFSQTFCLLLKLVLVTGSWYLWQFLASPGSRQSQTRRRPPSPRRTCRCCCCPGVPSCQPPPGNISVKTGEVEKIFQSPGWRREWCSWSAACRGTGRGREQRCPPAWWDRAPGWSPASACQWWWSLELKKWNISR